MRVLVLLAVLVGCVSAAGFAATASHEVIRKNVQDDPFAHDVLLDKRASGYDGFFVNFDRESLDIEIKNGEFPSKSPERALELAKMVIDGTWPEMMSSLENKDGKLVGKDVVRLLINRELQIKNLYKTDGTDLLYSIIGGEVEEMISRKEQEPPQPRRVSVREIYEYTIINYEKPRWERYLLRKFNEYIDQGLIGRHDLITFEKTHQIMIAEAHLDRKNEILLVQSTDPGETERERIDRNDDSVIELPGNLLYPSNIEYRYFSSVFRKDLFKALRQERWNSLNGSLEGIAYLLLLELAQSHGVRAEDLKDKYGSLDTTTESTP